MNWRTNNCYGKDDDFIEPLKVIPLRSTDFNNNTYYCKINQKLTREFKQEFEVRIGKIKEWYPAPILNISNTDILVVFYKQELFKNKECTVPYFSD